MLLVYQDLTKIVDDHELKVQIKFNQKKHLMKIILL